MKTISIPVNNRPDCLRAVLASIRACPTWRDWTIVFSCEPKQPHETDQLLRTIPKAIAANNPIKLGCWANTFAAAQLAMSAGSTINLYLEDDYLITPDTLTLVDQWSTSMCSGVLCLRRPHDSQDNSQISEVSPMTTGLFGCGFAWRSNLWNQVRSAWMARDRDGNYAMWDISICEDLRRNKVMQWRPLVNRSHGIGLHGTHTHGSGADLNLFGPAYDGEPINKFYFIP